MGAQSNGRWGKYLGPLSSCLKLVQQQYSMEAGCVATWFGTRYHDVITFYYQAMAMMAVNMKRAGLFRQQSGKYFQSSGYLNCDISNVQKKRKKLVWCSAGLNVIIVRLWEGMPIADWSACIHLDQQLQTNCTFGFRFFIKKFIFLFLLVTNLNDWTVSEYFENSQFIFWFCVSTNFLPLGVIQVSFYLTSAWTNLFSCLKICIIKEQRYGFASWWDLCCCPPLITALCSQHFWPLASIWWKFWTHVSKPFFPLV